MAAPLRRCREPELEVSVRPELVELWRKTALPKDPAELDAALRAAKLEPMIKDRWGRRLLCCGV